MLEPPSHPHSPHQNITLRNVPQSIASQPPSGGDNQELGSVQLGSPQSTRTTKGSRLKTAIATAAFPTTLFHFASGSGTTA